MKILVAGAGGQIGTSLLRSTPTAVKVTALGHADLDITDLDAVFSVVADVCPDVIINAAAYTAVDRAESDSAGVFKVNAEGAGNLAVAAQRQAVRFIHISTDFVFDGTQSRPYAPADPANPVSVYGASKLAGEQRVREVLGEQAVILRTAWVYASRGANFVNTMLRLMRERDTLSVVSDQVGSPTWAMSVAEVIWAAVAHPDAAGVYHWTDAGVASWYDFAVAIGEEASAHGLLQRVIQVIPIPTQAYPTPARRPAYSVLDCGATQRALGICPAHWRVNLRNMLRELRDA